MPVNYSLKNRLKTFKIINFSRFSCVNKSAAYVPPHLRGVQNKPTFKLHENELPSNEKHNETDECKFQWLKNFF